MNILVAPNAFKGSLSAFQVARTIKYAFQKVNPNWKITMLPIADGGDDTGWVLARALGGKFIHTKASNPIGNLIDSKFYLTSKKIAILEMSDVSGIKLIKYIEDLNPMKTSTYGTGELIKAALDKGAKTLFIGIGGSATVDGGIGMLQALGIKLLDKTGAAIGRGGAFLRKIEMIDSSSLDSRISDTKIVVFCDVENPLVGEKGAATVFGPQKGATSTQVKKLEIGLRHFAKKIKEVTGKEVTDLKHGGAAGGIAVSFFAFLGAELTGGSSFILDTIGFNEALEKADLVITAEGKLDAQTLGGKAPYEVALRAKAQNKPVIAFVGQAPLPSFFSPFPDKRKELFDAVFSIINKPMSLEEAIKNADTLLRNQALQVATILNLKDIKNQNN